MSAAPDLVAVRRALRAGLLAGVAAGLVAAGLGGLLAGPPGAWGGLLGVAVPVGFLSVTAVVALVTARLDATRLGVAVLGSWLVKLLLLIGALAALREATFYHRGAFFAAFCLAVVGYLLLEGYVVVRTRTPYVQPAGRL